MVQHLPALSQDAGSGGEVGGGTRHNRSTVYTLIHSDVSHPAGSNLAATTMRSSKAIDRSVSASVLDTLLVLSSPVLINDPRACSA